MTTVAITAITNTVVVSESSGTTVVTITTAGPQGPPSTDVIAEMQQIISQNYTLQIGYNGVSAGPVAVAATYAVTVPAGATWVII